VQRPGRCSRQSVFFVQNRDSMICREEHGAESIVASRNIEANRKKHTKYRRKAPACNEVIA
jgi:hypothetical protein